jgi:S-adenosylmethionine decarboxylase
MDDTGYHYLIDAHVRQPSLLLDASKLKIIFSAALEGFKVLNFVDHKFGIDGGVTGLFLLAESHCSYHTYPESAYIAIDVFTCGKEPSEIVPRLIDLLDCEHHVIRYQRRGTSAIRRVLRAKPQGHCAEI